MLQPAQVASLHWCFTTNISTPSTLFVVLLLLLLSPQAEHQGVLIRRVEPTAPEGAALKQWDILMAFDGEASLTWEGENSVRHGERQHTLLGVMRRGQEVYHSTSASRLAASSPAIL